MSHAFTWDHAQGSFARGACSEVLARRRVDSQDPEELRTCSGQRERRVSRCCRSRW